MSIWVAVGVAAMLVVLFVLKVNRKIVKIAAPELGPFNLMGQSADAMIRDDREAIRSNFYGVTESRAEVPRCDVLLVYALVSHCCRGNKHLPLPYHHETLSA
jgi:hypothetical protein